MQRDSIIVLDFGSQYTHLLARRVRELGVYSEIMLPSAPTEALKQARGIILSGGPASVYEKGAPPFNPEIFSLGIPVLGLCYGQQLIGQQMGGMVEPGKVKEYGAAKIEVLPTGSHEAGSGMEKRGRKESGRRSRGKLFEGLPEKFTVWMSHGDKVSKLPGGFAKSASTPDCENAAIANEEKRIYGLQFHPEVAHTEHGMKILSNFAFGVCGCGKSWTMRNYLEAKIRGAKEAAGDKKVFLLLSGGVDSAVCLALLARALGPDRVFALHVDTGFMRKGESALVKAEIEKLGIRKIHVMEAGEKFLEALEGVHEPEEKRNIIGQLFVELAMEELERLDFGESGWLLGQGTIYPDTIETGGTRNSNRIKTHHNRAPVIMRMIEQGKVIEPLNQLYKDEVRELGRLLGLPEKLVNRHPFPGPGLAIRILCSKGKDETDYTNGEGINGLALKYGYSARILPVKAVGVQGDNRTYRNAVLLEGSPDYVQLESASTAITNAFNTVNRVVYLANPAKVREIALMEAYLSEERITKLQEADKIAMEASDSAGLHDEIWQYPVVLLPIDFGGKGEGIVLRPVSSREAMTAKFYQLPTKVLLRTAEKIGGIEGIGAVMLDVTHKPPATIEWE